MAYGRSIPLDSWSDRLLEYMKIGGNERARKYFGLEVNDFDTDRYALYHGRKASAYREILEVEVTAKFGYVEVVEDV